MIAKQADQELQYDDKTHTYTINGQRLPSVTEIIKGVGLVDDSYFTEFARERGAFVHMATEYLDRDMLKWDTIDERIAPYVLAWEKFKAQINPKFIEIEKRWHSPTYLFAGTVDRMAKIDDIYTIIEIKSGAIQPWAALQTAAYEILARENMSIIESKTVQRVAVHLKDDGSFDMNWYSNWRDTEMFLACRLVYGWKIEYGGMKNGKH